MIELYNIGKGENTINNMIEIIPELIAASVCKTSIITFDELLENNY